MSEPQNKTPIQDRRESSNLGRSYHGMSAPIRFVVYFVCGLAVMGFIVIAMLKGRQPSWEAVQWLWLIPSLAGIMGVFFPRACDYVIQKFSSLLMAMLRR
jgi:hypothetical protein